jgi:hypothetical protein
MNKYEPTPEEFNKAEASLTEKQAEQSTRRVLFNLEGIKSGHEKSSMDLTDILRMTEDENVEIRQQIARFCKLEPVLDKLAEDEDGGVRGLVANNDYTTKETLAKLAKDELGSIRYTVASHIGIEEKTLSDLSTDSEVYIRAAVAKKSRDLETLTKLSKDENDDVRSFAAKSLNTFINSRNVNRERRS